MAERQGFGIGWAVDVLKGGLRARRLSWSSGMWLEMNDPFAGVYMHTADGKLVPWNCSQTDLLAYDWEYPDDAQS